MTAPVIALRDPRFETEKYGTIEALRAESPFVLTPEGAVVFLNQDDVIEVLKCENFRFHFDLIDPEKSPYLAKSIEHELLNMHADQHARLSRLLKLALRDRVFQDMSQRIDSIFSDLLAQMPEEGEVEFCSAFADPLPARVLGPMFDIPYEDTDRLSDWIKAGGRKVDALQSGVGIDAVEDANRSLHAYLRGLLRARWDAPGDDLFSELMQAEIDGDKMSEDEVVHLAAELASAGVDTTRAQLPLILLALLEHPEEMAKLRAEPKLALRAVDEGMRFAPLPWALPHAVTRAHSYKGIDFKAGDLVFVLVPAANRDPAAITEPNSFTIDRGRARHFSFGSGMHGCPSAQLARMKMAAALRKLVDCLAEVSLAAPVEWEPGFVGRGIKRMRLNIRKKETQPIR